VAGRWQGKRATARLGVPLDIGRSGYAVGSAVLEAVLPPHDGPTASVPVSMTDEGLAERDGMEAKAIDIVRFTIAEFFPRQVMHLRQILRDSPLINDSASANDAAKS
jgi:hypothetical protein